jgi:hypothetical protein
MLVGILCTVGQSFPCQLLFQCWDPYGIPLSWLPRVKVLVRRSLCSRGCSSKKIFYLH